MTEHAPTTTTDETELDEREIRRLRRRIERPTRLARAGMRLGAIAASAALILQTDILWNKMRLDDGAPEIHPIALAHDAAHQDETNVYIDGFAGHDGSWITGKMTPAMQAGHDTNTAALEYDAGGISVPVIAGRIAEMAEANHLKSVSLHGYSIGGMISLEIAALLHEKYGIQVDQIILDQSPSGADTIKSTVRDPASTVFVDVMGTAKSLGFDIEYSGIMRTIFDTVSPADVTHLQDSTTKLMRDQFMYGISADVEKSIKKLGNGSFAPPSLIFVTSDNPDRDYMVKLAQAEADYRELAARYGLPFMTITVEGVIHSRPDLTLDAYETAFADAHDDIDALNPRLSLSKNPIPWLRVKK